MSDNKISNGRLKKCEDDDFWSVTSSEKEVSFDDFSLFDPPS